MTESTATTDAILIATLLLAGAIFWHVKMKPAAQQAAVAASASDAPPQPPPVSGGVPQLALGQFAVAPDRMWLVLPRGA